MTRLLVTGSRDLPKALEPLVRFHLRQAAVDTLIHGAARGVDTFAARWAHDAGIPVRSYPAQWREHAAPWCRCGIVTSGKMCPGAGRRRNQQMLEEGQPTAVLAFPSALSRGTWDMVHRATEAGLPVTVIPLRETP